MTKNTETGLFCAGSATALIVIILSLYWFVGLCVVSNPTYKVAREVYANLKTYAGQDVSDVPLIISQSDEVNAWFDGRSITITTSLLDLIGNNKDEIAMVLAHEISHNILGHLTYSRGLSTPLQESDADKMGAFLMLRSGYNICEGKNIMGKFRELWGDDPTQDHPDNSYRVNQITMPWCTTYPAN